LGRVNPAEGGINKVLKEYKQFLKMAEESDTVPLGQERLSTPEAAKRFEGMSSAQKQGWIEKYGIEEAMKLVRRNAK